MHCLHLTSNMPKPKPLPTPVQADQQVLDFNKLINNVSSVPSGASLESDYDSPSRFVPATYLPYFEEIAKKIPTLIAGRPMPWNVPDKIGVYSDSNPVNVKGSTNLERNQVSLSGETMKALLSGDNQTYVERNPQLYSAEDLQRNPHIAEDPTYNPRGTLTHELTHSYVGQHPVSSTPEYYQASPLEDTKELTPRIPAWSGISDADRVNAIRDGFAQPLFNSHPWQKLDNQTAPIVAHSIESGLQGKPEYPKPLTPSLSPENTARNTPDKHSFMQRFLGMFQ